VVAAIALPVVMIAIVMITLIAMVTIVTMVVPRIAARDRRWPPRPQSDKIERSFDLPRL